MRSWVHGLSTSLVLPWEGLAQRADSISNEIAFWSLRQGAGCCVRPKNSYGYELPPQVIGEDMSENPPNSRSVTPSDNPQSRLQITDLAAGEFETEF